ncbi:hypothetical protein CJA_0186 [Cellvibrio japonicus Ueda107]|uniref:Uncharacterized protein n=1 Tax=Cellvibrio japonicus (strain Ueda107) TaxID=498211 RepID=B3PGD1_CELJU|nr:hypothetical protein [Cellvibrio japonicus]ACE86005.1 hypothetical protein CJA_0186 [Cellvibrio japonicus Ueda107]
MITFGQEGRCTLNATVFHAPSGDGHGHSPLPCLHQTATQFPFTYTYYGFGATEITENDPYQRPGQHYKSDRVQETFDETT